MRWAVGFSSAFNAETNDMLTRAIGGGSGTAENSQFIFLKAVSHNIESVHNYFSIKYRFFFFHLIYEEETIQMSLLKAAKVSFSWWNIVLTFILCTLFIYDTSIPVNILFPRVHEQMLSN